MKIGMISDTFLPQIGGAEIHVYRLSRTLRDLGHNVKIFTNTEGEWDVDGFKVIRNHTKKNTPLNMITDMLNLRNFIKEIDIAHCHYTFYLSFLTCPLAKMLRKPNVVTLHGLGTLDSSVGNSPRMKAYRLISFKFADAIIATSSEMAEVAKRFVKKEKIYMIPNGVDTDYFKPSSIQNSKKYKIIILSMRRLNPKNGVQYLIEAIPYLIKEIGNEIEFWIAGRKKLEHYLRERVKELNIEKYVKFIGEIPHDKTKYYYDIADIVVFPSSAESTSLACLEAMAMEKAIVASSLRAYKDLLGDNERGLLVKLFDRDYSDYNAPLTLPKDRIKSLADTISTLIQDEQLRKKLGKNARKYVVDTYDWKILGKKIIDVYDKVLSG
jgi:glycosyltransferase involved in cell wall biosynthesis